MSKNIIPSDLPDINTYNYTNPLIKGLLPSLMKIEEDLLKCIEFHDEVVLKKTLIRGAHGPQHITDSPDLLGSSGPTGIIGKDGPNGYIGFMGMSGQSNGITGVKGPIGPISKHNSTDYDGIAGSNGLIGSIGPNFNTNVNLCIGHTGLTYTTYNLLYSSGTAQTAMNVLGIEVSNTGSYDIKLDINSWGEVGHIHINLIYQVFHKMLQIILGK
jgi:hypothetical protein